MFRKAMRMRPGHCEDREQKVLQEQVVNHLKQARERGKRVTFRSVRLLSAITSSHPMDIAKPHKG